ncbi:MAG: PPOX class F420-dependent oxidoreductase [Pseudomonadales bacterium]
MTGPLGEARYLSLKTFRRDGRGVATPVWFALRRGRYYLFSAGDAGKVKRLRNDGRAEVAACNVRGVLLGPWLPASARLLEDPDDQRLALAALRARYGVQMRLADLFARLGGRFHKRAYIEVSVHAENG